MLLDDTLTMAYNKPLTKTAGAKTKSDIIQVSHFARDLGVGTPVPLVIKLSENIAMAEAGSVTAHVMFSDNADMSDADDVLVATLTVEAGVDAEAGYVFAVNSLPYHSDKKYMQVSLTVSKAITTGAFTAAIVEATSLV